jgi:RimJ/RimL family protein N-acetyltransferase
VEPHEIKTARLVLRPTRAGDFPRALEIRSSWNVARYLSGAAFPPEAAHMSQWFATHESEWQAGTAFRFAVEHRDVLIGIVDISDVADNEGELGYWFDEAHWGRGYGPEAAEAVVRFGFDRAGLDRLVAGHSVDNLRSARLLERLGFVGIGDVPVFSRSRGTEIMQRRLELTAQRYADRGSSP